MGDPVFIQLNQLFQALQAECFVQLGNAHPIIGTVDALKVFVRTEQQDLAVVPPVSF